MTLSVVHRSAESPSMLKVGWTYNNTSAFRPAFEVPTDIVVPLVLDPTAKLSDYVTY